MTSTLRFRTNVQMPPGSTVRQDLTGLILIELPSYEALRQFGFDSQFRKLPGLYCIQYEGITYFAEAAGNNGGGISVRCVEVYEGLLPEW